MKKWEGGGMWHAISVEGGEWYVRAVYAVSDVSVKARVCRTG